jgi:hypothetical protein
MKRQWNQGKVVETLSERSYAVLNEDTGNIIRRNRVDLREINAEPNQEEQSVHSDKITVSTTDNENHDDNMPLTVTTAQETGPDGRCPDTTDDHTHTNTAQSSTVPTRRSERSRQRPPKFEEFVLY